MVHPAMRAISAAILLACAGPGRATEHVVPAGADVGLFFAKLPKGATSIVFSAAATYHSEGDILLPEVQLLVIDGRGCKLTLGPGSNGFTRHVPDQKAAMRMVASRYTFRDFAAIQGGRKAIDLSATLGSTITNCRMTNQSVAAIDLRFCLMARLQSVLVTNPKDQGIVVRTGDWPGANWNNSQSNHTVLDQCRVHASKSTTNAFVVLNSSGVCMTNCISEGAEADRDLYLSAATDGRHDTQARNSVVKQFILENFHIEHRVRKEHIFVNMPAKASVQVSHLYMNVKPAAPVINYMGGQLNLSDIGWWTEGLRIVSRVGAPHILVQRCHGQLRTGEKTGHTSTKAGCFELRDPLPGNEALKTTHIRITDPAN